MIQIESLKSRLGRPGHSKDTVKLRFNNEFGQDHELCLNQGRPLPDNPELREALQEFLADYGFFLPRPAGHGAIDQAVVLVQARLDAEQDHILALQYLANVGAPPAALTPRQHFEAAANEYLELRELRDVMLQHSPGMTLQIGRMVRGACRNISERLTDRLVKGGQFPVSHTPTTCPDLPVQARRVREHCVPLRPIHNRILSVAHPYQPGPHCLPHHGHLPDVGAIADFLEAQFTVAFVGRLEDARLHPKQDMPNGWHWDQPDKMARYANVPHFRPGVQPCPHCVP